MRIMQTVRIFFLMVLPAVAVAQGKSPASKGNRPAETKAADGVSTQKVAEIKNGVLVFDALTIEGRVQRPQAIYTSERSVPAFGALVPEDSFLEKIVEAVEKEPF